MQAWIYVISIFVSLQRWKCGCKLRKLWACEDFWFACLPIWSNFFCYVYITVSYVGVWRTRFKEFEIRGFFSVFRTHYPIYVSFIRYAYAQLNVDTHTHTHKKSWIIKITTVVFIVFKLHVSIIDAIDMRILADCQIVDDGRGRGRTREKLRDTKKWLETFNCDIHD